MEKKEKYRLRKKPKQKGPGVLLMSNILGTLSGYLG